MIHRGKGVACMFYPIGFTEYPNPSSAYMKVEVDGSAVLYTGSTDIGQGSTTVMCQIASEVTGIPYHKIRMVCSDTLYTPYDTGSVASRVTYITGNAVKLAAEECRDMLFHAAAIMLNIAVGDVAKELRAGDDCIYLSGYEQACVSIAAAAHYSCLKLGKPVHGKGMFNPVTMTLDPKSGHGKPYGTHVFAAQIAIVDVDDETGKFDIVKIYAVHDCGKVLNPLLLEGQIFGGVGMGVGFGCYEELWYRNGKIVNDQFTNYILPTAMDVPPIAAAAVERYDAAGAFGAKGIGEPSLLPTAAAIANAIHDAVGVFITDLPITPEKVFMAMKRGRAGIAEACI
ncbi:MAG: Nicotinate dehydrogenase medium molybdopterin subunit [Firmicutes bacterium ADurb.Bin248]|nr:MAG: Nicotinate dehydrogenase medium molybdopterin subunit [Firmicutes bacterium ADurb.Bin248]HOF99677.1 molybdopterin-dependent oxidoreductase [Clostridia bacterium]HPK15917.1 molybdopterin-dependent oxidoreductase [Clostridia bacterium]